jgi:RNA polymerase sigma-70 factor, ECF subfamily
MNVLCIDVRPSLPRLRSIGRRILGCPHLAEDAVQDCLVCLWQKHDPPGDPVGWLIHAVVHRSLHLRRSNRRRRHHESCVCPPADPGKDPTDMVWHQELDCLLRDALTRLPPEHNRVFVLRHLHGLDYREMAARLNVPLGTVRSRLNRARTMLRRELGPLLDREDCFVCGND